MAKPDAAAIAYEKHYTQAVQNSAESWRSLIATNNRKHLRAIEAMLTAKRMNQIGFYSPAIAIAWTCWTDC